MQTRSFRGSGEPFGSAHSKVRVFDWDPITSGLTRRTTWNEKGALLTVCQNLIGLGRGTIGIADCLVASFLIP
jgi:hypothetical protein